jgi:ABC-type transport system involved in cytochrome bd biosynthesis fused ATPase/permease subunit
MVIIDHSDQLDRIFSDMEIAANDRERLGRMRGLHIVLMLIEILLAGVAVADFVVEIINSEPHGKTAPILLALAAIVLLVHILSHIAEKDLHKSNDEKIEMLRREIKRKKRKIAIAKKKLKAEQANSIL